MILNGLLVGMAWMLINAIDNVFSWQTFERPIVAAALTGLLLGDFHTGIIMGASLEAIFMGISAIGGSLPTDATGGSILAVSFTILSGADTAAGLSLAIPIGSVMNAVGDLFKPVRASLAPYWEHLAESGRIKAFKIQTIIMGTCIDKLPQGIVLFLSIAFGVESLETLLDVLPAWVMTGLSASAALMTGMGMAILLTMIWNKQLAVFFFAGFVLAKYLSLDVLAIAILALTVAVVIFFNDKRILELERTCKSATPQEGKSAGEEDFF